jgi:hypothetical protein
MKKIILFLVLGFNAFAFFAQSTPYLGEWELCKIVNLPADTQLIKKSDSRYVKYNFNYNNTFSSYHEEQKMEATGKWGLQKEDKRSFLKLKSHTFTKTKEGLGDYEIKIWNVTPASMIEYVEEKKKIVSYRIYCKIKS